MPGYFIPSANFCRCKVVICKALTSAYLTGWKIEVINKVVFWLHLGIWVSAYLLSYLFIQDFSSVIIILILIRDILTRLDAPWFKFIKGLEVDLLQLRKLNRFSVAMFQIVLLLVPHINIIRLSYQYQPSDKEL